MKEQPEALRLAAVPIFDRSITWQSQATIELRRLSAENASLRQIVQDFPPVEAELREVSDRAHRLEAQRDALLKALKEAVEICIWPSTAFSNAFDKARAAIAKAEEKT